MPASRRTLTFLPLPLKMVALKDLKGDFVGAGVSPGFGVAVVPGFLEVRNSFFTYPDSTPDLTLDQPFSEETSVTAMPTSSVARTAYPFSLGPWRRLTDFPLGEVM